MSEIRKTAPHQANARQKTEPEKIKQVATARQLTPAARRALAEAALRRTQQNARNGPGNRPKEVGGRRGPEPTRYGDWEKKGIATDF